MLNIRVTVDIQAATRWLNGLQQEQVPYATAVALTRTAMAVKRAEIAEMKSVFDRPTPYTLNSLYVKPATKKDLRAVVWLKDDTFKGTPASKYLAPEIFGGERKQKRFERSLAAAGLLPSGMMAVPGKAAEMDQYGNMSRGQITAILSAVRASSDKTQNRRKGKKTAFFVGRPGGGRAPMGIWLRFERSVRPIVIFVRKASYTTRFRFFDVAQRVIDATFKAEFDRALADALRTAR